MKKNIDFCLVKNIKFLTCMYLIIKYLLNVKLFEMKDKLLKQLEQFLNERNFTEKLQK